MLGTMISSLVRLEPRLRSKLCESVNLDSPTLIRAPGRPDLHDLLGKLSALR